MNIKPIDWSDEKESNATCAYNHVNGSTNLGPILITWKGWKDSPSYDIECDVYGWLQPEYSLEAAKDKAWSKHQELVSSCITPY